MEQVVNREIHLVNGEDRFHIMQPIGKVFGSNTIVYRAAYVVMQDYFSNVNIQDKFAAVSYVVEGEEPEALEKLKEMVDDSGKIPNHPNILGIGSAFTDHDRFCITFPYMDLGSLRTIMASRFPDGLPEACIVLGLSEALRGLSVIHECNEVHREISAGHIFVSAEPRIKLAFRASVHDLSRDVSRDGGSDPSLLSEASICDWAAAPEVVDNHEYTSKADIWLIGITALELAYGGLKEANRDGLDMLIRKINKKRKLPKRYKQEDNFYPSCFRMDQGTKKKFSKGFQSMVVSCLSLDPLARPDVFQLLSQQVFTSSSYDAFYSYDLFDVPMTSET